MRVVRLRFDLALTVGRDALPAPWRRLSHGPGQSAVLTALRGTSSGALLDDPCANLSPDEACVACLRQADFDAAEIATLLEHLEVG